MEPITADMIRHAHKALAHSYAPYSKFTVAACICTTNNTLYTGVNIESSAYGLTLCAEASAIACMVSAGEQAIKSMVILAGTNQLCPPCGACRQRIHEFSKPDTQIHLCTQDAILKSTTIDALLPLAFTL